MKFWYKGHHYNSQIKHTLLGFTHWWNIKGFAKALWRGEKYLTWFGHMDDCCDYWITDPDEIIKAIRLDDDLGIEAEKEKLYGK